MPTPPSTGLILQIAIPSPLRSLFDYLPPPQAGVDPAPGMRVRVPFGHTVRIGLIMGVAHESQIPPERLRPVLEILDDEPLLPTDSIALLRWAAGYYHHPLGDAALGLLPTLLKNDRPPKPRGERGWRLVIESVPEPTRAPGRRRY